MWSISLPRRSPIPLKLTRSTKKPGCLVVSDFSSDLGSVGVCKSACHFQSQQTKSKFLSSPEQKREGTVQNHIYPPKCSVLVMLFSFHPPSGCLGSSDIINVKLNAEGAGSGQESLVKVKFGEGWFWKFSRSHQAQVWSCCYLSLVYSSHAWTACPICPEPRLMAVWSSLIKFIVGQLPW